jgi:anaerobic ribonucleoside-triphosphate reductase
MTSNTDDTLAEKIKFINDYNLPRWKKTEAIDAILDNSNNVAKLPELKKAGCPYCGSHDLDTYHSMVLCQGCTRRVA